MTGRRPPPITLEAFEAADVHAERFDHEAHVFVAWSYLQEYDLLEAIGRYKDTLIRLTTRLGIPEKYHETITWFFMLLIAERRTPGEDWQGFRNANADVVSDAGLLHRYYDSETLASDTARLAFVVPDRLPFAA